MRRFVVSLLVLFVSTSAWAQPSGAAPAHPRVVLILCDALTFDDLHDNRYPHLYQLAESSAIGLMNTAVSGPKTPTVAVLTLALGRQQRAEPTDELAYDSGEKVQNQHATAGEIFRRQTGY